MAGVHLVFGAYRVGHEFIEDGAAWWYADDLDLFVLRDCVIR